MVVECTSHRTCKESHDGMCTARDKGSDENTNNNHMEGSHRDHDEGFGHGRL